MIIVSTQVINEVHWNLVRKYGVEDEDAKLKIDQGLLGLSKLSLINKTTYDEAFMLRQQHNISFWDSLITGAIKSAWIFHFFLIPREPLF